MASLEANESSDTDDGTFSSRASDTTKSTENSDTVTQMVNPDDDVVLIIGKERKSILVYSRFLCGTSLHFKNILDLESGYNAGNGDEPSDVIVLSDDDGLSMTQLFPALCGVDPDTDEPTPREIQKIGVLVDKCDVASRLFYAGSYWLRDREIKDPTDCWYLLTAAYDFCLHEPFRRLSKTLIMRHEWMSTSLLKPATEAPGTLLGFRLACEYFDMKLPVPEQGLTCRQWPLRNIGVGMSGIHS